MKPIFDDMAGGKGAVKSPGECRDNSAFESSELLLHLPNGICRSDCATKQQWTLFSSQVHQDQLRGLQGGLRGAEGAGLSGGAVLHAGRELPQLQRRSGPCLHKGLRGDAGNHWTADHGGRSA